MSEPVKEEFCGICVAGITALAGVGTAGAGTRVDKKKRKIYFIVGASVTVISILVIIYLLQSGKCNSCSAE